MADLLRDLRHSFRTLMASPGFTVVAVVTLALGIGVNSSIFSIVNAFLLRPLPAERPEELVDVYGRSEGDSGHRSSSYPDYLELREQSETLSGLMAYSNFFASLAVEGRSEVVIGEVVSDNYFDVLGVEPLLGRAFVAEEVTAEGASPAAILSHETWTTRFGGRPDLLGDSVRLNGISYRIVGIMPPDFPGMFSAVRAQLWIPVTMVGEVEPLGDQRSKPSATGDSRLTRRGQRWLWMRGRVASGFEAAQVRAELRSIMKRLAAEHPVSNEDETVEVLSSSEVHLNPDFDSALVPAGLLMLGVVGLVLLVACANLANMLLARASSRSREVAVRLALGAGRGRLLRQLLTESMLLGLLGGGAGLLLAVWLVNLIEHYRPPLPVQLSADLGLDWRVLLFTLAAAILTGLLFGLLPALRASRPDLVASLKDGDSAVGEGRRFHLRDVLVIAQVAVSIVLLVAGALLVRSLGAAHRVDLGYDVDRIAFLELAMEMNGYDEQRSATFFEAAVLRLEDLPGVEAVTRVSRVPLSLNNNGFSLFLEGHQTSESDRPIVVDGARVDEHYFETLELRILEGRAIEGPDIEGGKQVAVVTRAMAERFWPQESALDKTFRTRWESEPYRIVGVVEDYKVNTPGEAATPYLHVPRRPETTYASLLVRTRGPAATQVVALEEALRSLDPGLVFLGTGPLRLAAQVRLLPVTVSAWLIGAFGVLALVLAAVGLYGVIGYAVSRRRREIGIRIAMGADAGSVVALVLRRGFLLVLIGGVLGGAGAVLLGHALSSLLFVSAFDPLSYGAAFAVLVAVSLLAHVVPLRRATRVDPVVALRAD